MGGGSSNISRPFEKRYVRLQKGRRNGEPWLRHWLVYNINSFFVCIAFVKENYAGQNEYKSRF